MHKGMKVVFYRYIPYRPVYSNQGMGEGDIEDMGRRKEGGTGKEMEAKTKK